MSYYYETNIIKENEQFTDIDYDKFFRSPSLIRKDFYKIWYQIVQKTGLEINLDKNLLKLKKLVVYDILDGNRSTLTKKSVIKNELESVFYVLNLIHTLKSLGARCCYIMIHTSYNRKRGEKEFENILEKISLGAPFIKKYAIQNSVCCSCIYPAKNYEHSNLLNDITESTKKGDFNTYFLFDYNEEWIASKSFRDVFDKLPDIDVHIRHTKFQVSGGWIPGKMSHSVFLYSQNGTKYSNWDSDELITLIALALLAKLVHKGEILNKNYCTEDEIASRYESRELDLFNKVIYLRKPPKKFFVIGSPTGIYQFYY